MADSSEQDEGTSAASEALKRQSPSKRHSARSAGCVYRTAQFLVYGGGLFITTFDITIILVRIIHYNTSKRSPCFAQRYQCRIYIALIDANDVANAL